MNTVTEILARAGAQQVSPGSSCYWIGHMPVIVLLELADGCIQVYTSVFTPGSVPFKNGDHGIVFTEDEQICLRLAGYSV